MRASAAAALATTALTTAPSAVVCRAGLKQKCLVWVATGPWVLLPEGTMCAVLCLACARCCRCSTSCILNSCVAAPGTSATVSAETTALWGGFVQMIVMGYLDKRWAWYDLSRLQLEILVSTGRRMPPAAVAELAQLVYTTLHQVAPQWPTK